MSECPDAIEANATRVPSGDSEECEIASPGTVVIWDRCAPGSGGAVHRLRLPLAGLLKSTVRPSRDTNVHRGPANSPISRTAARPFVSGSDDPSGTLQISWK